jgi:hypothetical protein
MDMLRLYINLTAYGSYSWLHSEKVTYLFNSAFFNLHGFTNFTKDIFRDL